MKHDKNIVDLGITAFNEGKSDSACPYPSNNSRTNLNKQRYAWMSGYYFASISSVITKLGHSLVWED